MGFALLEKLTNNIVNWLNAETPPPQFPLSDFERIRYEIKSCDVLLVEGRSRVSNVIKIITNSPWSHTALYIGRLHDIEDPAIRATVAEYFDTEPDTQLVIESYLGQGTIIQPLSFYKNDHVRICRPKGLCYKDAQEVVRYAVSRVGTDYDVRQIFDLARLLFPWMVLPRKWRSSLFTRNVGLPTRTVCSSMIAEAFAFIQFPILPLIKKISGTELQLFRRNPKLCTPSDFDYSPYFEIIKYPFIDFSEHSNYRLLPWKGNGVLADQEADMYLHSHEQDHLSSPDIINPGNEKLGINPNLPLNSNKSNPDETPKTLQ